MAQYEFICDQCGAVTQRTVPIGDYDLVMWPTCHGAMRRRYSPIAFVVRGGTGAARKDRK